MRLKRLHPPRRLVGVVLAFAAVLLSAAPAEPPTALTPYQIKVGLLYNFAIYTEWPKAAFTDGSAPFVFGVLGADPFGADLDFLKRKPIKGRSVVVKPLQKAEEALGCHILFISASEKEQLPHILKTLEKSSVLTVSEVDKFIELNGMVNFVTHETIGFEINEPAVEKAGLRINSYVLKMKRNKK